MVLKKIDKYLLKQYIFPFFASVITIVFLFSIDFIIKILDTILSKGVDFTIVIQYFFLNLAWILTLAVPMGVLLSSLMVFSKLSGDNEITAMLSAGIHPYRIMLFPIIGAFFVTLSMVYFQDKILPEANHKAAELGYDIKRAKPASIIEENFIITTIPGVKLLIQDVDYDEGILKHIRIFKDDDKSVISAKTGKMLIHNSVLFFLLNNGEIVQQSKHENGDVEVSRLQFTKHIQTIDLPDDFKRTKRNYRSDREMDISSMQKKVDTYENQFKKEEAAYLSKILKSNPFLAQESDSVKYVRERYSGTVKGVRKMLKEHLKKNKQTQNNINSFEKSISAYMVEIHKKYSLSFACIIFILVGIPLGTLSKKGGMGVSIAISFVIFVLYWSFLITGERMADKLVLPAGVSMWMFNVLLFGVGIFFMKKVIRQDVTITVNFVTPLLKYLKERKNLKEQRKRK